MSLQTRCVRSHMTANVIFLEPEDSIAKAHELMQTEDFRHIPILSKGRVVGIVSDRDILGASIKNYRHQIEFPKESVDTIMTQYPVTCFEDTSVGDAARIMVNRKIDCLPVVNQQNELRGLLTSTDLLELLCQSDDDADTGKIPYEYSTVRISHYLYS